MTPHPMVSRSGGLALAQSAKRITNQHTLISLMDETPAPRLNIAASRFEIVTPHGKAVLEFVQHDGTIDLQHTSVPSALEGGGYGSALARAALDYSRQNGLKVIPTCAFVRTFVKRHHAYDDLLATST